MGLFKRTVASCGLVALLCVSGAALADENNTDVTADVTVSDVAADTTNDPAGNSDGDGGNLSGGDDSPLAPVTCDTLRPAESIDIVGVRPDWLSAGSEGFEFHTGIVDADDIDQDEILQAFEAKQTVTYDEFVEFLKPFNDPNVDVSEIKGIQEVTVVYTWGGTCTGAEWHGSAALAANRYDFEVIFPIASINPPFPMGVLFDGQAVGTLNMREGDFDAIEYVQALNSQELSVEGFMAALSYFDGDINFELPKGVACGKHTVQFVDDEDIWSVVTVVYSEGINECSSVTPPVVTPPGDNVQTVPPARGGGYGSYSRFLGSHSSRYTPVAPRSVVSTEEGPIVDQGADDPALPVTGQDESVAKGDKGSDAAPAIESESSSHAALFALVACVALAIVVAASVIGVRRTRKSS